MTLVIAAVAGAVVDTTPMRSLEWLTEGARLKARARAGNPPPTGEVVIVSIDMAALHAFGRWPFPRSYFGQVIDWLGRDEGTRPGVFAWDILFTEESSSDPELDKLLAGPLGKAGYPVILGAELDEAAAGLLVLQHGLMKPVREGALPALAVAEGALAGLPDLKGGQLPLPQFLTVPFAFLNADADADGVVRRIPLVVRVGGRVYPSLVLQTAMAHLRVDAKQVEIIPGEAVVLRPAGRAEVRIPVDGAGNYRLNYRYELVSELFPRGIKEEISFATLHETLLKRHEFGEDVALPAVGGKILITGQTANGLTDIGPSQLAAKSAKVMVHFNALENILRGDYLKKTPVWPMLAGLLAAGLGLAWVLDRRRVFHGVAVVAVPCLVAGAALVLLTKGNVMIPLAVPLVAFGVQQAAVALLKIREEQAQRERIRRMFGSYVSPELVRRMVEARAEPQLGGHEDEITAFFSDIQGFSAFSEVLSPADLVVLLNEYLGGMTDVLQENGGALDKYIGDAIVAMFGGLVPVKDHARHACEAAARMQMKQAQLRARWKAQGDRWPKLVHDMRTRIGLNSGQVVVGNMGSQHRFNYTMMGDTVNLAARCESGAKAFGVYTAATGATVEAAKAAGCACVFRELDRIVVKGRKEPAVIYEIVALSADDVPEGAARCLELFEEGRRHYLRQEWDEALRCFGEAEALEPLQPGRDAGVEANPSLLMQARCRVFQAKPPGADWDGINRMTTK